jgi:hypothetical protein
LDGKRLDAIFPIEHFCRGQQGEDSVNGRDGVSVWVSVLKDRHEAVASLVAAAPSVAVRSS